MLKRFIALFKRKNPDAKLISKLRSHCAKLMLQRDEEVQFAPFLDMYGPIRMWGATNPQFEFEVFDDIRSEYMTVHVAVSTQGIRWVSRTSDEGYVANEDGSNIETRLLHKAAFILFLRHIASYFPLTINHKIKRTLNGIPGQAQAIQVPGGSTRGRDPIPTEMAGETTQGDVGKNSDRYRHSALPH